VFGIDTLADVFFRALEAQQTRARESLYECRAIERGWTRM
jgi:hypothetical protein